MFPLRLPGVIFEGGDTQWFNESLPNNELWAGGICYKARPPLRLWTWPAIDLIPQGEYCR